MKRDGESCPHTSLLVDWTSSATTYVVGDGPVIVRPFEPSDEAAVRALFIRVNRLMAPRHLEAQFEAYIAAALREEIDDIACYYGARSGRFFVATVVDQFAGMFGLEQAVSNVAEVRRMYVHPRFRGHGIGRILLAHAEREARRAKHALLILSTSELQTAALTFYRTAGYREVRQEIATHATNKTVGGMIRRFHFEKALNPQP
ncbi:MAG: GNAT family N-acetyltransferase [Roseovarius sp.]|nr:GNAT family N-acetyltransferase [Roseovarius sp.]